MESKKSHGIIDTLSDGFGTLNKKLFIIAIPIVLDLLLWFTPRLSPAPLVDRGLNWFQGQLAVGAPSQDMGEKLFADTEAMMRPLRDLNLLGILTWQVPGLFTVAGPPVREDSKVNEIGKWSVFISAALALAAVGVLLASIYLGALAQLVRGQKFPSPLFPKSIGLNGARLLSYNLLLGAFAGLFSTALFLFAMLFGGLGPQATSLFLSAGLSLGLLLLLHLFFVDDAIFVGDAGPIKAVWQSINIVQRNFWSALWFFVIINIISIGIRLALLSLMTQPPGLFAAILINAYISSGLVAAGMIYYRERFALWQEALKLQARADKQRV